jgi:hypothetical protein
LGERPAPRPAQSEEQQVWCIFFPLIFSVLLND